MFRLYYYVKIDKFNCNNKCLVPENYSEQCLIYVFLKSNLNIIN